MWTAQKEKVLYPLPKRLHLFVLTQLSLRFQYQLYVVASVVLFLSFLYKIHILLNIWYCGFFFFSFLVFVLCLLYVGVQHILCCVFCFDCLRLASSVPNVANFSGLSIIDCHFGFSIVYLVPNVHKIFSSRHQRTFNQSINQSNRNVL